MILFKCSIKYPQRFDPVLGSAREWNSDNVAISVYIIQSGYCDINININQILSLLA